MKASLHLGLNCVDPDRYSGWDGALFNPERDAAAGAAMATLMGFSPMVLLSKNVSCDVFRNTVSSFIRQLQPDEEFLLHYSGHGWRHLENYGVSYHEGICLYDGLFSDTELHNILSMAAVGSDVTCIWDCCHAGGLDRAYNPFLARGRRAPEAVVRIMTQPEKEIKVKSGAAIKHLCACGDQETAADGDYGTNGAWTGSVTGAFDGFYQRGETPSWELLFDVAKRDCEQFYQQHPVMK